MTEERDGINIGRMPDDTSDLPSTAEKLDTQPLSLTLLAPGATGYVSSDHIFIQPYTGRAYIRTAAQFTRQPSDGRVARIQRKDSGFVVWVDPSANLTELYDLTQVSGYKVINVFDINNSEKSLLKVNVETMQVGETRYAQSSLVRVDNEGKAYVPSYDEIHLAPTQEDNVAITRTADGIQVTLLKDPPLIMSFNLQNERDDSLTSVQIFRDERNKIRAKRALKRLMGKSVEEDTSTVPEGAIHPDRPISYMLPGTEGFANQRDALGYYIPEDHRPVDYYLSPWARTSKDIRRVRRDRTDPVIRVRRNPDGTYHVKPTTHHIPSSFELVTDRRHLDSSKVIQDYHTPVETIETDTFISAWMERFRKFFRG